MVTIFCTVTGYDFLLISNSNRDPLLKSEAVRGSKSSLDKADTLTLNSLPVWLHFTLIRSTQVVLDYTRY